MNTTILFFLFLILAILLFYLAARFLKEYCLLIGAAFFTWVAVMYLSNPPKTDLAIAYLILASLLMLIFPVCRHKRSRTEFLDWLSRNMENVQNGSATYGRHTITLDTEITQYTACRSFLVASFVHYSRVYFDGEKPWTASLLYSIITILGGWWKIPGGIVKSIKALSSNIAGGEKLTIHDLIDRLDSE